jgi:tRNA-modifying protein YgfZ
MMMTDTLSTREDVLHTDGGYAAALDNVALYDASAHGRLRLTGRNPASLIHRLSTNDIERLSPGDGTRTVLVNHNARIIDLLTVYALPEHFLVTTSAGQREAVQTLIQKNIFFMDRVTVEDISDQTVQLHVYGPRAAGRVQKLTGIDVSDWPLHHIQAASFGRCR